MMAYLGVRDTNLWTTLERSAIFLIMLHKLLKESFLALGNDMATCLMARTGLTWISVQTREIALYSMLLVFLIATSVEVLAVRSTKKMLASGNCHCWWKCLVDTEKWKSWRRLLRMKSLKVFYPWCGMVLSNLKWLVSMLSSFSNFQTSGWKPSMAASVVNY